VLRQPQCSCIQCVSGQPTVLAKPASKVMPVMAVRACCPYRRTTVAKITDCP